MITSKDKATFFALEIISFACMVVCYSLSDARNKRLQELRLKGNKLKKVYPNVKTVWRKGPELHDKPVFGS